MLETFLKPNIHNILVGTSIAAYMWLYQTNICNCFYFQLGSSVSIMSDCRLNDQDPWQRQRTFPLAFASRLSLRPTQPPIHWVLRVLSKG
jgi:hypothetical protein